MPAQTPQALAPSEPRPTPAWKRPRREPLPLDKQPKLRGPRRKLVALALAIAVTANIAGFSPTTAQAQVNEPDICDAASGPEGVTIGALRYVSAVFEDAAIKMERYKSDPDYAARYKHLESIETQNDFLCDVPRSHQATLLFLTTNLLVSIMDVMHAD